MNNRLKINLSLILLFFIVSLVFFYDEHFYTTSSPIHSLEGNSFLAVILSIGVILSAALYNFSLYIYTRHKQYIFYTLAQFSAIVLLVVLDSLYISPFDKLFAIKSPILFDISQIFMLMFSILFLQAFFKIYKIQNLDLLVKYILILTGIDLVFTLIFSYSIITKFIPIFIPIALILGEAFIDAKRKDLPFYILIVAWSMVVLVVLLEYIGFMKMRGITFPFFHIALAFESIMLSVAIAYKFRLLEEEKEEQKALLIQQSKLANMGEMISSIVHQWRQPLNTLSFGLMNIKNQANANSKIKDTVEKLNGQLDYMSQTIEDFRNFYNPSKTRADFSVYSAILHTEIISNSTLQKNGIQLEISNIEDFTSFGVKNELEQVILAIILNAKDALVQKKIKNPELKIIIKKPKITIQDNAEAIHPKLLDKIFEPYFTTKENGDGLGLYISKMIIEKEMNGKLYIKKEIGKTSFIIEL